MLVVDRNARRMERIMNGKKTVMNITIAVMLVTSLNAVAQGGGGGRGAPESSLELDSNGDGALQSGEYMPSRPAKR